MAKEKFVLLSLKEDKAKKLAQVISNDSCRKILDYLADKNATATELSKKLNIPLPTVHYNIQHLVKGGLVKADEYHYSSKGKEVNHYSLANKYIIIAPKSTYGIKEKLRSILPVLGLGIVGAGLIQIFSGNLFGRSLPVAKSFGADIAAKPVMQEAARAVPEAANDAVASGGFESFCTTFESMPLWQSIALWFFLGVIFAVVVYLIIERVRKK